MSEKSRVGRPSIIFAPDEKVRANQDAVLVVVRALIGHTDALVTDESTVSDMLSFDSTSEERASVLHRARTELGIPIEPSHRVVDVAMRLKH